MTDMIHSIKKCESAFDQKAERFVFKHPYLGLMAIFIGMPLFVLAAVGVGTTLVMLAASGLLGWL